MIEISGVRFISAGEFLAKDDQFEINDWSETAILQLARLQFQQMVEILVARVPNLGSDVSAWDMRALEVVLREAGGIKDEDVTEVEFDLLCEAIDMIAALRKTSLELRVRDLYNAYNELVLVMYPEIPAMDTIGFSGGFEVESFRIPEGHTVASWIFYLAVECTKCAARLTDPFVVQEGEDS